MILNTGWSWLLNDEMMTHGDPSWIHPRDLAAWKWCQQWCMSILLSSSGDIPMTWSLLYECVSSRVWLTWRFPTYFFIIEKQSANCSIVCWRQQERTTGILRQLLIGCLMNHEGIVQICLAEVWVITTCCWIWSPRVHRCEKSLPIAATYSAIQSHTVQNWHGRVQNNKLFRYNGDLAFSHFRFWKLAGDEQEKWE